MLLIGSIPALLEARAVDLEASLAQAITNKVYQDPTPAELTRARELFQRTLQGQWTDGELTAPWAELGFEFQRVSAAGGSFWLLSEPMGDQRGRGWYLFRTDGESAIALEAPHARNDIHTGMIALRLFLAGQSRALAAATVTRHRADMAHLDDTFFHAFTLAFARACPTSVVVQLHGFDTESHPGTQADIIASAGTVSPEPWLADVAQRLQQATSSPVWTYPQDTRQLGATQNAQGRALHATPDCRFLHLELSRELRERLLRDEQLRQALLGGLTVAQTR